MKATASLYDKPTGRKGILRLLLNCLKYFCPLEGATVAVFSKYCTTQLCSKLNDSRGGILWLVQWFICGNQNVQYTVYREACSWHHNMRSKEGSVLSAEANLPYFLWINFLKNTTTKSFVFLGEYLSQISAVQHILISSRQWLKCIFILLSTSHPQDLNVCVYTYWWQVVSKIYDYPMKTQQILQAQHYLTSNYFPAAVNTWQHLTRKPSGLTVGK